MEGPALTRRRFAGTLGAALGASLLAPGLAGAEEKAAPPLPVRLDSNENPYGPSPRALEALDRARAIAGRYPDEEEDELVRVLARLHGVKEKNVILGCGSGEILRMADLAFATPGRTVVAADPTFEAVLMFAKVTRAEAVKVPLTSDFRHDLKAMAAACDARTGLVYVCNPNNPTGTIVRRDELDAFLAALPAHAIALVDEAYHHFVEDPRYSSAMELLPAHPGLLVVRTFSKIYGLAGMRLGYAVGSEATIAAMQPYKLWSNANAAVVRAALASLADPDLVPRVRKTLNDTRRWLVAELAKDRRRVIPSETNFLMIEVGRDVGPIVEAFRARQIRVGRRFAALPTWLRVTIGTPEETSAFLGALRELVPAGEKSAAA